ncbi:hypothetical protein KRX51_01965 [Corynebacterium sp. TAE3-ERU12]|uniref:hypothetical protein n=1 Tax=Corynebacterium sp. TAE3-ERU12 TaxID=2849491 RepID=UPI001C443748|nr:hypothetical protein [Corynebacterium sp. TAE3-ERU12]MBV7294684.1 hypothetical protein [Corynebacterium sp. TAE3-ERU12]
MRISFVVAVAALTALSGCSGDQEPNEPTSNDQSLPPSTTTTVTTKTETETSSTTAEPAGPSVVDEADFTPPDGPNARLFVLADGYTSCFYNQLGAENYLSCRSNFTNPPNVVGPDGDEVPANAISFTPDGIYYQSLVFPDTGYQPKTLNAGETLESFGFSCTANGAASVACTGPQGTASIDNGTVTGAEVPPPEAGAQPSEAEE